VTAESPTRQRYVKLTFDIGSVVLEPVEEADFVANADEEPLGRSEIWLTDEQYEKLPEFEG
jgi:hypothetical protein